MREITLNTEKGSTARVEAFVEEELERIGVPHKILMKMCIVIDEIFSNIVNYAYGPNIGPATVKLGFDDATKTLTLVFIDEGVPFDPRESKEPDIELAIEDRPIGGLGLFMVKKIMDHMDYRRENGRNILTLTKCIV